MNTKFLRWLISIIVSITCKVELFGEENIPPSGGFIVVSNHLGRLDVFLVYKLLKRNDIIMGVAEKYQKYALYRYAAKSLDAIWVDRYNVDFVALRKIIKRLNKGGVLVIAPEGTRSPKESLIYGKSGAAYLAVKTNLPILPVGVTGTEDRIVKNNLKKFRKSKVSIQVGKMFTLPPMKRENHSEKLADYSDEIMCRIAYLLPKKYRGVYANHPRLEELLSDNRNY